VKIGVKIEIMKIKFKSVKIQVKLEAKYIVKIVNKKNQTITPANTML
jgi:hypothetical protein